MNDYFKKLDKALLEHEEEVEKIKDKVIKEFSLKIYDYFNSLDYFETSKEKTLDFIFEEYEIACQEVSLRTINLLKNEEEL